MAKQDITEYKFGKIAGLSLVAMPSFFVGTFLLWLALSVIGIWNLKLPLLEAIATGFMATLLYWVTAVVHQLGHAMAARRTGYPMSGIRLGKLLVLATSLYPEDEAPLPATIHIRRALGGPIGSFLFTILSGFVAYLLYPVGGVIEWLAEFVYLTSLVIFTLGAILPLGFTDGSTLLEWWGKH